jgi:hypothetical protein
MISGGVTQALLIFTPPIAIGSSMRHLGCHCADDDFRGARAIGSRPTSWWYKSHIGMHRCVGLGVIAANLVNVGRLRAGAEIIKVERYRITDAGLPG